MAGLSSGGEVLVARDAELNHLLLALRGVVRGGGRLVLLSGEPGIGKTRLAREVLAHARAAGNLVLVGRCFEQHTAVPFFPFTELLGAALAAAPSALKADAQRQWPELAYLLPDLIRARPRRLEGPEAQLRLFRATCSFLQALAEGSPLVLLLDDLHWADATSLALLLFLGRHVAASRMLILGTYRDVEVGRQHSLEGTVSDLLRELAVEEVHLHRLGADGTAALVRARLGSASVSDGLVSLIHRRAQGNPFFTEELLKAFVENGDVAAVEGRMGSDRIAELEVPRSIRSVIGARLGRLPRQSQELLRLASLLGPEFDLDVLLTATGETEVEVLDALDAVLEAGIIGEIRSSNERFAFAHVLIQQTLYEEIPVHRRRRLHLRVGQALEHSPSAGSTLSADKARHFLLGGEAERAARYAIEAGDQAALRYAHAEAAHHYQVALDLLLDEGDHAAGAAEVQYKLGAELYDLNRLSEALASYEASLDSFKRLGDRQGQALAHWGIARLHQGRYNFVAAEPHVDEAVRLWPSEGQGRELVLLLCDATRIKSVGGSGEAANELAKRAIALAEHLGDVGLTVQALSYMAEVGGGITNRPPELIPMQDRAIELALQDGDWRSLSRLYLGRGTNRMLVGDLEGNVADRRRAVDAAERTGETVRLSFANYSLGYSLMQTGAWEEARAAIRRALTLDPQQRHPYSAVCTGVLARIEGRPEDAAKYFEQFADDARDKRDFQGVTGGLFELMALKLQIDRSAEVEAAAREALALLRRWGGLRGLVAGAIAETLVRIGGADAEAVVSELERLVDESGELVARPPLLRARALLFAGQGAVGDALDALSASAAHARWQHAFVELAQTLMLLASLARQHGDHPTAIDADAERLSIVERIGPEARVMAWARGLPHPHPQHTTGQGPLSPREREVAALIVGGLSNRQIAESLVISERTVENHVRNILARLGVATRAQIAAWAVQHGLTAPTN
jgi:DNA-binding CsgD family transcriptional regulator/tetratricopeptide (TPR) repeat protein